MSGIRVSYCSSTATDPQAKTEDDKFELEPGEAIVLIYIRRLDGTIQLERSLAYNGSDYSTHPDDVGLHGAHVMQAIQTANRA